MASYTELDLEGLVHGSWERPDWASIRSHVETIGNVESEDWLITLDFDRWLKVLDGPPSTPDREFERQAHLAVGVITLKAWHGWPNRALEVFCGPRDNPGKLFRKGLAHGLVYMNGGSLTDAEAAFRMAR